MLIRQASVSTKGVVLVFAKGKGKRTEEMWESKGVDVTAGARHQLGRLVERTGEGDVFAMRT
jgi:hypothetical protein